MDLGDPLRQGTLLVVNTKKWDEHREKLGPEMNIFSLIAGKLCLVVWLEGQKVLVREDGPQKEAASFCNLTKGIMPDFGPLFLLCSPRSPGSHCWLLVFNPLPPFRAASFPSYSSSSQLPSIRDLLGSTDLRHPFVASMSHGNILLVQYFSTQTASYKQKCRRNPFCDLMWAA